MVFYMNVQKVAETDDFNALGEIYAQSWKTAYRGIVPQDYLDDLSGSRWAKVLSGSTFDAYVIREDGQYIGTSSIGAAREEKMVGWGEIISIYLLPEYFGKGYAEPLFKCAVNALCEKGYTNIYLWVLKENIRAQRFYEKHGFHNSGEAALIEIAGAELTEIRYIKNIVTGETI
jgi:Acetyltransferases